MKQFLKFTFFKFFLTFILAILFPLSELFYTELDITGLYHLKDILFFPYYQLTKPFAEFGKLYFEQNLGLYFLYSLIFFPFFAFYCYFLSCVISFLINKVKKGKANGQNKEILGGSMRDLICIKTYNNRFEAELTRGFLETKRIKSIITADDCGGVRPELGLSTGGVHLSVKKEDVRKALEILEYSNKRNIPIEKEC